MNARVIVQINKETGQKNVVFTTDPLAPVGDFLVGSWPDCEIMTGTVLLLTLDNDTLIESLLDTELHSVYGEDSEETITLSPDAEIKCRALLGGVTDGDTHKGC